MAISVHKNIASGLEFLFLTIISAVKLSVDIPSSSRFIKDNTPRFLSYLVA